MKNILNSFLIIILFSSFVKTEVNDKNEKTSIDYIVSDIIQLKKQGVTKVLSLSSGKALIESTFGTPAATTSETSEMDGLTYVRCNYNTNSFWYFKTGLESFDLKTNTFYVNCGNGDIKVGDDISVLNISFPNSYNEKQEGKVFIGIKTASGKIVDSYLVFDHDKTTGLITRIAFQ